MLRIRRSWILVFAFFISHCKTPQSDVGASVMDIGAGNGPAIDLGVELSKFSHQLDVVAIKEMGARLGCERASRWMSFPKSGSLRRSIQGVLASNTVYETVKDEFFNQAVVLAACRNGGEPARKQNDHGIRRLLQYIKGQNSSGGLTLIMVGGFGSHIGYETSLDASVEAWDSLRDELEDDSFAAWQIECSNSFAPNERCAKELIETIIKREMDYPRSTSHQYLLWGYSKGGNTIIEALRQSKELRNKTLAVLTNGTPIGGSSAITMLEPAIKRVASAVGRTSGKLLDYATAQPWAYLMTPAAYLVDDEMVAIKVAKLLTREESAQIAQGAAGMKPSVREDYLYKTIRNADFSRADGRSIPIFHSAAVVDIATMEPWPILTVESGKLTFAENSFNTDHLGELGFTPVMRDFPLNDTCVALQHSVIPRDAVPEGLTSELIALFAFDHSAHRLTPLPGKQWDVPHLEAVDALIETMVIKLEGGQL